MMCRHDVEAVRRLGDSLVRRIRLAGIRRALEPLRSVLTAQGGIRRRTLVCDVTRRTFSGRGRKAGGRVLAFIASTQNVGRDGDVILARGWDLDAYRRNPVVLQGHDAKALPVGRAVSVSKVLTGKNPHLAVSIDFATAAESPNAEAVYQSYRKGFSKALSVGFRVLSHYAPGDAEREQRGLGPFGNVIDSAELLEVSTVAVPADPGALCVGSPKAGQLEG